MRINQIEAESSVNFLPLTFSIQIFTLIHVDLFCGCVSFLLFAFFYAYNIA